MLDTNNNCQRTVGLFDIDSQWGGSMMSIRSVYTMTAGWSIPACSTWQPKETHRSGTHLNRWIVIGFLLPAASVASFVFLVNYSACATWTHLSVSLSICWRFTAPRLHQVSAWKRAAKWSLVMFIYFILFLFYFHFTMQDCDGCCPSRLNATRGQKTGGGATIIGILLRLFSAC